MKSRAIPCLLSIVFALGLATTVVARAHAQANTTSSSDAVQIDYMTVEGTALTISGKNFGSGPAVFVGETTLTVSRNSDTEIVAALPALDPGVHIVKVVRDAGDGGSSESTLLVR